jgi:hypothetical protein
MVQPRAFLACLLPFLLLHVGCAVAPQRPQVRVATATAADLESVKHHDEVWYVFEPGDVVPLQLAFVGAVQGGSPEHGLMRAKRKLYFVMRKNQPMEISFDGKTFAGPESSKFVVAVVPRPDAAGGKLGWIIYIGESGDMKAAIEAEMKEGEGEEKK